MRWKSRKTILWWWWKEVTTYTVNCSQNMSYSRESLPNTPTSRSITMLDKQNCHEHVNHSELVWGIKLKGVAKVHRQFPRNSQKIFVPLAHSCKRRQGCWQTKRMNKWRRFVAWSTNATSTCSRSPLLNMESDYFCFTRMRAYRKGDRLPSEEMSTLVNFDKVSTSVLGREVKITRDLLAGERVTAKN